MTSLEETPHYQVTVLSRGFLPWKSQHPASQTRKRNCRYKFGSWSYDGLHIYLVSKGDVIEPEVDIADDSEWKVVKKDGYKNVVRYPCCPGSYIDITYTISISGSEKLRMGIVLMLIMLTTGIGCQ